MINSETEFLSRFGWDDHFYGPIAKNVPEFLKPAKVICEERNLYRIQLNEDGEQWASVKGKMQFDANSRKDFPSVGDWVLVEMTPQADRAIIHSILPRKTLIQRKQIGSSVDMQILAANVDYVFIATSLNEDLNHHRLERYMAVAMESGAKPIVLLTKSDVYVGNLSNLENGLRDQFPFADVHSLSKSDFDQAMFLAEYMQSGKTSVVIGSSGVGKSTLVNFLIGEEKLETQGVREYDGKGRHTTTSRSLHVSRYGGLIIDTPGMRELQLLDHAEGLQSQFSDIEEILKGCRFSNCQHQSEPGCSIKAAIENGDLSEERWQSYLKLEAEVRHGLNKQEKWRAAEQKKVWKKISVDARNLRKFRMGGV